MGEVNRTEGEPHSRLTRLTATMVDALDGDPERRGDEKCMVFLQDGERGGIVLHGYEDDLDAIADLFQYLQAMFEANGQQLLLAPLGGEG